MRETLVQKIRALLAKTMENGCTECEALAALQKAQEMMAKYEVSEEEVLEVKRQTAEMLKSVKDDLHSIKRRLQQSIARFTETMGWIEKGGRGQAQTFAFCGLKADVEFADWLLDSLSQFVMAKLADYLLGDECELAVGQAVEGFVGGCITRIQERLQALRPNTVNAQAMVVAKKALIREATADMRFRRSSNEYGSGSARARELGRQAGDGAGFGRPLNGQGGVLRLGHGS